MFYSFFEIVPILAVIFALEALLLPRTEVAPIHIWGCALIMLVSIAGKIAAGKKALDLRMTASYRMCADKRLEAGEILKRAPLGYFNENRLGELAGCLTTTLGEIENLAVPVIDKMAGGFVHSVLLGMVVFLYDQQIGSITLAGILLSLVMFNVTRKRSEKLSPKRQAAQMGLVSAVLEYIQGMSVVKAFGMGERSQRDIDYAIAETCRSNTILERSFTLLTAGYQLIFKVASVAVLVVSCQRYFNNQISLSKCLALLTASFMLYSHVELVGSVSAIARAIAHSLECFSVLDKAPLMDVEGKDISLDRHEISLENVSFAYKDKNVLDNINITVPQGKVTAIVGPSGSGKTTLCNIMARFWDVREGGVFWGGIDVREFSCESLLKNVSIVFQNVYLFEGSVMDNIGFGKAGSTREEIEAAARKACCHDFIVALPEGYNTHVGEGGCNLSGGERQRISIARAFLKNAPVIFLDEATASLDPENERGIRQSLSELTNNKTVVMIAHRLATVRNADQILVMDKGRVIQHGTHQELMRQCGLYHDFVKMRESAENWTLQG
ncbi:MAG: ABC transporter ATP-binding protein/permease [Desulfovibrio sp.]|nr:ABC transporter ATP-binding protein/permease [Desulfovibrio sp.]